MTLGAGLVQLPLLALGVASLVSASPLAFHLLRLLGAAHLVWLGVKLLLAPSPAVSAGPVAPVRPLTAAREGMIANLINPWPISVMVAFLPQFVDPAQGSVTLQMLLLGATQNCRASWCSALTQSLPATPAHGSCGVRGLGFGSSGSPAVS